jgi:GNAT superfamily N-acetyltransferase
MEAWSEFNVAIAGAAAALAGLIIVALSVNIGKIIESPTLTSRAAASISALVVAVLATAIGLIPGQPVWAIGLELVAPVAVAGVLEVFAIWRIAVAPEWVRQRVGKALVGVVPVAAFAIGAVLLIAGIESGFVAVAIGCLTAIAAAVLFSWVALVEVLR